MLVNDSTLRDTLQNAISHLKAGDPEQAAAKIDDAMRFLEARLNPQPRRDKTGTRSAEAPSFSAAEEFPKLRETLAHLRSASNDITDGLAGQALAAAGDALERWNRAD